MNLSELRYTVAVAQERNFRRAAERCFISQPALSTAIQKLEEELGVQIFERSRTEVSLTGIGERLVEQAQRVLEEAERVRSIAREGRDQLVGVLRLGVIHTIAPYVLPDLIPVLHARAPEMPLEVEESTTAQLEAHLKNGQVDVVILALPFASPGIEVLPLYDEVFEVVVPAAHRWARKRAIGAAQLAEERVLLLNSGHCFSNQVAEACPEVGRVPGNGMTPGNSLETIRNMVASGSGVTVLPATANSDKYRSALLCVVPFTAPAPSRRVALAWRRSFGREKAVEALAQSLRTLSLPGVTLLPA
ncbi:MAG: LysR family transcriptional regulator [Pseudomonadota bacterium]|nr:LysR family transcriptional regulator [Pseudomonadota bacterium]